MAPDTLPQLKDATWLRDGALQEVLAALTSEGAQARVVGGAVRNTLLGKPVKDIDIATTSAPDGVARLAARANIKVIETGLAHGTLTLLSHGRPFEVTTLRRDVETDGRRAVVAFTTDWRQDASRRDFTINALYCDANGTLFDPLKGLDDLVHRRVRFIGKAEERIREDFLRILRFFRFSAEYAHGDCDPTGLAACAALQDGLDRVSAERIRSELIRLLVAPGVELTIMAMAQTGILARILKQEGDPPLLSRLCAIEEAQQLPPDAIRRLAALTRSHPGSALALRERLRLSSSEYERLATMTIPDRGFDPATSELQAKTVLYRNGVAAYRDGLLLAWARSGAAADDLGFAERFRLPDRWPPPDLPVTGADVLGLGIAPGPRVGQILNSFETWWIAEGFPEAPDRLARRLAELAEINNS